VASFRAVGRGGLWSVWLFFVFTKGKRIPGSAWYAVPVALLLDAMIFRLIATRSRLSPFPRSAAPLDG
jgi:hypothetical protein